MGELNLHAMTEAELPAVMALLANSGSTARSVDSWRQDRMTSLVLGEAENPAAVMPLSRRTVATAPGRNVHLGWLSSNQFASRMSLRRQTRGTAGEWATLLPEVDALVVLRRDESSLAARWYSQTGFHDVLSIRCLYLDMDAPPLAAGGRYQVHVATPSDPGSWDATLWQSQMASVYHEVYASCGGAPPRSENFWAPALANHYYRDHYQFQIIGLWTTAPRVRDAAPATGETAPTLMGYAVVGWSGWHSKRPRMDILELATRQWDTGVASDLIRTTCQLAWSKQVRQVRAVVSAHDPYRGHLMRTGFVDRWGYVMLAKWLHAQRYLDRMVLPAELESLSIQLAAQVEGGGGGGGMPLSLRRGGTSPTIELQCDARTLTRLLLNRTEVTAALQDGTLFASRKITDSDATRLSAAFPWTPWVFHMLDYI